MSKIEIRIRVNDNEVVFFLRPEEVRKMTAEELCKEWIMPSLENMRRAALADYSE